MKKVLLDMYLTKNLGDDLFLQIISKRYSNTKFYVQTGLNYDKKNYPKNITFVSNFFTRGLNKIDRKFNINKSYITNYLKKKSDAYIVLGGSMFIENSQKNQYIKKFIYNKYFKISKPLYILGSNFGPYKSNVYYSEYKKVFESAIDVSFREEHSYKIFSNLKNARVNPDIVFSLDTANLNIKNEKNVIISVINCKKRFTQEKSAKYEKLIIELIKKFDNMKYSITLMSFCKSEGDEETIKEILSKINDNELKTKINQYNYDGNIEKALKILENSEIIVGSRFHANVLGLVMNKTILPIAYSDKILNTLKDINFKGKIIDIRKIDEFNINELTKNDLKYKINIDEYRKDAEKHFEKLDKFLKD